MGTLDSIPLKKIRNLLKKNGWIEYHGKGSHIAFKKDGENRPIVIPVHGKEIVGYCVLQIIKRLKLTRDEFLKNINKL